MDYISTSLDPILPTMKWTAKWLDDLHNGHYLVDTTDNPKIDWPENTDEDPFGLDWEHNLCLFVLQSYVQGFLELTEVLSAQRVSHPEMFGYHIYFNAKAVPYGFYKMSPEYLSSLSGLPVNIFAEVFISRKNMSTFIPEVTYWGIMLPEKNEDDPQVCRYCVGWVRHPKCLRTIRFPGFPDYDPFYDIKTRSRIPVCKGPWHSYISPKVRYRVPQNFKQPPLKIVFDLMDPELVTSGVTVEEECKIKFLELKTKETSGFIVFKLVDWHFFVEKSGVSLEELRDILPDKDCRYALVSLDFKIVFVEWSPEGAYFKTSRDYYHCREFFKRELSGRMLDVKVTDKSEMARDVIKKCRQEEDLEDECQNLHETHL